MMPRLYVLIPTYGRAPLLARTLASLAECALPASYAETVVVENGPQAGAEAICQQADARLKVRYLHVEKANKSHALNEALKTLPEDAFVVFFDDDVRFAPEVLTAYAEAAEREGPGHFFGGPVSVDYEERPPDHIRALLPASAKGWRLKSEADLAHVTFLGANWAIFLPDLVKAGGFDVNRGPGLVSVGQESEMQWRLRLQGARAVYVEQALVWHYVPKNRCSPEWLLERATKIGKSRGRRRRAEGGMRLKSLLAISGQYAQALAKHLATLNRTPEERFVSRVALLERSANIKGFFQS